MPPHSGQHHHDVLCVLDVGSDNGCCECLEATPNHSPRIQCASSSLGSWVNPGTILLALLLFGLTRQGRVLVLALSLVGVGGEFGGAVVFLLKRHQCWVLDNLCESNTQHHTTSTISRHPSDKEIAPTKQSTSYDVLPISFGVPVHWQFSATLLLQRIMVQK